MNKWIIYTGKTTDMKKIYRAEGSTYEEVYNNFVEKYGYDVLDEDHLRNPTSEKEWRKP